jgi:anti-anti-sigma factor
VVKVTTQVESGPFGPVTIITVSGRLMSDDDAELLGEELVARSDGESPMLIVNLRGVEVLNSAAVGVLIRAYSRCRNRNGRFALCEARPAIARLFEHLQMYRICEHYDSDSQALAAFELKPA